MAQYFTKMIDHAGYTHIPVHFKNGGCDKGKFIKRHVEKFELQKVQHSSHSNFFPLKFFTYISGRLSYKTLFVKKNTKTIWT